jgi:hypothetical protein
MAQEGFSSIAGIVKRAEAQLGSAKHIGIAAAATVLRCPIDAGVAAAAVGKEDEISADPNRSPSLGTVVSIKIDRIGIVLFDCDGR